MPNPTAGHPILGFITVFQTLRQYAFRTLFLTMLVFTTIIGVTQTLIIYSGTYLFGFSPEHLAIAASSPIIGILLAPPAVKRMSHAFDKKGTLIICLVFGSVFAFSPQFAFLGGFLEPLSVDTTLVFVYLVNGISQIFFIALYIIIDSMLSDTIDQHELDTGRREEGLYFAAGSFAQKASFGLGSFVAGLGLDFIRFPQGANPGEVSLDALTRLSIFAGPISMVLLLLSIIIIRTYPLDQKEHARISQAIHDMKVEGA